MTRFCDCGDMLDLLCAYFAITGLFGHKKTPHVITCRGMREACEVKLKNGYLHLYIQCSYMIE